uniref:G-protein coupled receptors family 1 profile domain-containing protein n=1 Tax=Bos mutus grunniens TaxID=30521 RepID=A0A8B9XHX7_BOSMU
MIMIMLNQTDVTPSCFILNGIPGLEDMHMWISFPFCSMYVVAMVGNCGLLYLIRYEDSLHRPMYYFLAMLSLTDLVMCSSTTPKALCIFWFQLKEISFEECLVQMFFIHTFTGMESGVLMLMALDYRYVAICYPLRYSTILTNPIIAKAGLITFLRGVLLVIPLTFIIKRLPYCRGNIIHHTYCDHMAVAKLSCGNIKINVIYGLMVALLIGGFDILCISVSYTMILWAVVSLSSAEARWKAFSTCTAHICAIVFSYSPAFFVSFLTALGSQDSPSCHIIVANIYLLLPPTMNPIVYGVKTKQIRDCVIRILLGSKDTKSHSI